MGNAWLTVLPTERGFTMSDALFTGAVRRRLGGRLTDGPDAAGHGPLLHHLGRVQAHNGLRDTLISLLGWLGGLKVENLDRPVADMTATPFAGVHRPDVRIYENGRAPVYVDVALGVDDDGSHGPW